MNKQVQKSQLKKPDKVKPEAAPAPANGGIFPIVGIGASAGGLEALEQFLGHVPKDAAMAYVIVQHLDPTHKGIMPELLSRVTTMKVIQAKDRLKVLPGCVYIIPPNKDMSILHGVLHLFVPKAARGLRLPIDFFFRSLALDRREKAVAVILSGMGSDGTIGIKAIKENNGLVLVQEPTAAKCDGMPKSAISTGLADFVAPANDLPGKIIGFFSHLPIIARESTAIDEVSASALEKIVILLRMQTGNDFSLYKKNTLYRRIERRMGIHKIDKINTYVRYLKENPQELEILFKEMMIGVTSFFRDPEAWERLRERLEEMINLRLPAGGRIIRAWVAGCSTGEEAYSLAIIFSEVMKKVAPNTRLSFQIFATDIQKDAIDKARQGVYPESIASDVSLERLSRFFVKEESSYRICKELREMVIFAPQNLIMDPPFAKLDIVVCRNLFIYLITELQKKFFLLFHYCLNPGGLMFLGSAESVGNSNDLFKLIDSKEKIYKRGLSAAQPGSIDLFSSLLSKRQKVVQKSEPVNALTGIQPFVEQMILKQYSPAAVLVNEKGDIVYISGKTGKYLEPAAGKANMNIFAMARDGIRYELPGAIQKAHSQKIQIIVKGIIVAGNSGEKQAIDLIVNPINEPPELCGMVVVVFNDISAQEGSENRVRLSHSGKKGDAMSEKEISLAQEELRITREEMSSAQEELMSSNEELQSTNEELTTSKEEMQSLNEELQTVNAELSAKVTELSRTNNDMKNLLNSTDIATVFLDNELNVRRFTTEASKIIKLIPGDVGRPVTALSSLLIYPEMLDDTREVLRTLVFFEKKIKTPKGELYMVRIMPYRTFDNVIDGVVITFTNYTRFLGERI